MLNKTSLPIGYVLVLSLLAGCQTQPEQVLLAKDETAPHLSAQAVSASTRVAATALLGSLTEEQRKLAVFSMDAPLRKDWHFIPRDRKGLMFGDMSVDQKKLVHNLMQTALSDTGYLKSTDIIWLESVLYELSNQRPMRSPNNYVLQIYGDPANDKAAWGWRLEGHHLSINLTYSAEDIGVTPMFFGTNPAVVQQGPLAGKRVLADAHNLAIELAESMSQAQRKKMMLAKKPRDVISLPGRESMLKGLDKRQGIDIEQLTSGQRALVQRIINDHLYNNLEHHHKLKLIRRIDRNAAPDDHLTTFAWAGPIDADEPFYYRIHTPTYVIEYSCQGKNHVHAVVHDLNDPLQEDLLKKHFEQHEH